MLIEVFGSEFKVHLLSSFAGPPVLLIEKLFFNSRSSQNHVLPLGSDFPVEGVNPLLGFYAAVTRLRVDGKSPHGDGGW